MKAKHTLFLLLSVSALLSFSACVSQPDEQTGTDQAELTGSCMEMSSYAELPRAAQDEIQQSYDRAGLDFRAETKDGTALDCEFNEWAIGCWTDSGFVGCMKAGNGKWSCCADCHATSDD